MSLFGFIKRKKPKSADSQKSDRGMLVFANTSEVIRAESVLRSKGWDIRVMGPPPEVRTGCDLVIEFPLIEQLRILRELEEIAIPPLQILPVTDPLLEPMSLFHTKDFGKYLMIRAANMKLIIDKETLNIVNVSGGGCPDVPYLACEMVGKKLAEAPKPRDVGHTLCAYTLQLAYEEALRRCLQ